MEIEMYTFIYEKVVYFYGDECETRTEIIRINIYREDEKIVSVKEYVSEDGIIFQLAGEPQTPQEEELEKYLKHLQGKCNGIYDYCTLIE